MTRSIYEIIVRCHPPTFRRRFADEMLGVFDEAGTEYAFALLLDGIVSFARQWVLRTDSWKVLVALCGGVVQVFGFGVPLKGHQYWAENRESLTSSMQELTIFALGLVCTLFVLIISVTLWNARFQRRR